MSVPLHVLFVEDSDSDMQLLIREMRKGGYDITYERVDTAPAMSAALDRQEWAVIIADYAMPNFSASGALKLLQDKGIDIPFIVVSGRIDEQTAVELMRAGAHDFVPKSSLTRLVPVVERELQEAEVRRDRREAEERFAKAFQFAPEIIAISELETGRYVDVNESFIEVIGYSREEIIGRTAFELNIWVDSSQRISLVQALKAGEIIRNWEFQFRSKSGRVMTGLISGQIIDLHSKPCLLVMVSDITEQKKLAEERTRLARRIQLLLESTDEGIFSIDTEGNCTVINKSGAKILGYEPAEIVGKNIHDLAHFKHTDGSPYPRSECPSIRSARTGIGIRIYDEVYWRRDGTAVPIEYSAYPVVENGATTGAVVTFTDITARKSAEQALRESEEKHRTLIERLNDGVIVLQDTIIKLANQRFTEMAGYQQQALLGTPLTDYLTPEENALLYDRYNQRMSGEAVRSIYETVMTRCDGSKIDLEVSVGVINYQGRPADLVLFRDIRERKKAEAELARSMEETQRDHERDISLERVTEAGLSSLNKQELLNLFAQRIVEGMNADFGYMLLVDQQNDDFIVYAAYNAPNQVGSRIKSDVGFVEKISTERRTVYVAHAEHDPVILALSGKAPTIKSLLSTLIIERNNTLGIICVATAEIREFDVEDIRLFEAMADRVASSLVNVRLYEALVGSENEVKDALERERHFSLLLQRAMLPGPPHIGAGYSAAAEYIPAYAGREIGGDFYDVFRVGDCHAGVLIGDVSGKGLEAASLAATTRSTIHAFVHETSSAGEALTKANSVISAHRPDFEPFVTVFLAVINLCNGEISYANAGHLPAAIYHKDGNVEFSSFGQLPFGLTDNYHYTEFNSRLDPGDKLILYTDGISEARTHSELFELSGIERIIRQCGYLSAEDLASEILAAASQWAEGKLRDDAAIVVIERHADHHQGLS